MNNQEYLDAFKRQWNDCLSQADPLVELTPEAIASLTRQAQEAHQERSQSQPRQGQEKRQPRQEQGRRARIVQWVPWAAAASVLLALLVGRSLWQEPAREEGRMVAEAEIPMPTPAPHVETGLAPSHQRQTIPQTPRRRGDGAGPVSTQEEVVEIIENLEILENSRELSRSQPAATLPHPSLILQVDDQSFRELLAQDWMESSEQLYARHDPSPEPALADTTGRLPFALWLEQRKRDALEQVAEFLLYKLNPESNH